MIRSLAAAPGADSIAEVGLMRHQTGDLANAALQYHAALEVDPAHFNSLHMLGAIAVQECRYADALRWFLRAGAVNAWTEPMLLANLRIAATAMLAAMYEARSVSSRQAAAHSKMIVAGNAIDDHARSPRVSVIVPSFRHDRFVAGALRSVFAQTWRDIELIVIDDGSPDRSVEVIQETLADCPLPHIFIARENRGAHATINQGIALATGQFVNVLNSDDEFAPTRIARFVEEVARRGRQWGFAQCDVIDETGGGIASPDAIAEGLRQVMQKPRSSVCATDYLVSCNPSISSGNIFVRRSLAVELGGYSARRYNHDWEFCLAAVLIEEPCVLDEALYRYRVHASNTISENRDAAQQEAQQMLRAWFARTARPFVAANPLAGTELNDPLFWSCMRALAGSSPTEFPELIAKMLAAAEHESSCDATDRSTVS